MPRTPLAWCNLTHDKVRFALFVLGIVFAVVLMFVQIGFRGALLDSNSLIQDRVNADLVLVSQNRQALIMREPISRHRLNAAASVSGVKEVHPLFLDNGLGVMRNTSENPDERTPSRSLRVVGVNPDAYLLKIAELDPANAKYLANRLKTPGTAIYDRKAKVDDDNLPGHTVFGPLKDGIETELAGKKITLVGGFDLGPDFTTDGLLIVSEETFAEYLRRPYTFGEPLADVDLGLIRLHPGADREQVRRDIRAALAQGAGEGNVDVDVLTPEELVAREHNYWLTNTPIGFVFAFGMIMGFTVGMVICYQILSGDVADHLAEYATLKAIGYGSSYLAWVVIQEALILAVVGFAVGLAISTALFWLLTDITGMPMTMTLTKAALVLASTVGMCVCSALLALVKLWRADPADVF